MPDLYTNVQSKHLRNHGNREHSLENCPEIKFRNTQELRDRLPSTISANDGSLIDLNKIGKNHGNMISAPIYEFQNPDDHCPPLMHDNDGVCMDLIRVTSKIAKKN